MKYYKNADNELFVDPIQENHSGLVELTEAEFNAQWVINTTPSASEQAATDKRLAKQTGELYASTGVTVPFTNEVAVGVMQVEKGFETAEKAVAAGLKTQAYLDALVVNLEISDTVSLELTPATILEFSAWFWTKRGSFF